MITGSTRIWTNNVQSPVTIESKKYQFFFFLNNVQTRNFYECFLAPAGRKSQT
jgi:hypothetical protein